MEDLQAEMLYARGTVRKNRDLPIMFWKGAGLIFGLVNDGLAFLNGETRHQFYLLEIILIPLDTITVKRKEKNGARVDIDCPTLVKDYSQHMGYVDKADMFKSI